MYSIDEIKELKPMSYWSLAAGSSANQKKKLADAFKSGYILTLKRDGALYRAILEESGDILQSRTTSKKTDGFVQKQDRVPTIMEDLGVFPKGTVLMGEICYPLDFGNTISSDVVTIMGCNADKAIARQEQTPLNYYIFDVLMYGGETWYNKPYSQRIEKIQQMKELAKDCERLEFAQPHYTALEATIQNFLDNGWEGGLLMKANEPYVFEKRPAWVGIKIKQSTDTIDLVIMGVTPATREYTGKYPASHTYWENVKTGELVEGSYYKNGGYVPVSSTYFLGLSGGFQLGAYYGENLIEVCRTSNLTDAIRDDLKAHPEHYIGKVAEVTAMLVDVEKKSLRHPKLLKIREDKNPEECLYTDVFR